MDSDSFRIIENLVFFNNDFYQYNFQACRVGKDQKPYIAIYRRIKNSSNKAINSPSNYISFPLSCWSNFTQTTTVLGKFVEIAEKEPFDETNNFQVINSAVFYQTDLSQFRIQIVRTGKNHNLGVNLIKFYKESQAEFEYHPTRKFISFPIPIWESFLESIHNFQSIIERSFKLDELFDSKANLTLAPKKDRLHAATRTGEPQVHYKQGRTILYSYFLSI